MVPITLVGTGDLMPNAKEYLLYPGKVKVRANRCLPAGWTAGVSCVRALPLLLGLHSGQSNQAGCAPAASTGLLPSTLAQSPPASTLPTLQVVIHPAVSPKDADTMTSEAYAAIASSLPPELVAPLDEDSE